jgi:hypothetical protein
LREAAGAPAGFIALTEGIGSPDDSRGCDGIGEGGGAALIAGADTGARSHAGTSTAAIAAQLTATRRRPRVIVSFLGCIGSPTKRFPVDFERNRPIT